MAPALTDGFDYIVVGAGSAGCVIAARLTEDSACRVLLLEAGGSDRTTLCRKPGMVSIIHTVPQVKARFDWGYKTHPRADTLERKIPYARGKVLGGSSAINGMVFVRGHEANFDGWRDSGCPGWGWEDVLPYYRKLESFEDGGSDLRGGDGPIQVTRAAGCSPVSEAFLHACSESAGVPILHDYNTGEQEGVSWFQMSARDGVRYSTSEAYVHPASGRDNLRIETGAHVLRLELEGSRVVGVVWARNGQVHTSRAESEVVLCGGSIGSPQTLMLSGIGPADHLRDLGIDVVADLPVGNNLHDHLFFPLVFVAPEGGHRGTALHFFSGMLKEYLFGKTWFARTVFEAVAFLKSDPSQPIPDIQFHTLPWAYPAPNQDADGRPEVDKRPALTVQPTLIYPKSRGELLLRSDDPADKPRIDPHFLEEPEDRALLLRGIEIAREIMAHPAIAPKVTMELEPGPEFVGAALERELPNRVSTVYHPVGTCRMGSDERAVVDAELRVRGVQGLRVADASIMPQITGGNTNAPCIMIGEKAADLLRGR